MEVFFRQTEVKQTWKMLFYKQQLHEGGGLRATALLETLQHRQQGPQGHCSAARFDKKNKQPAQWKQARKQRPGSLKERKKKHIYVE